MPGCRAVQASTLDVATGDAGYDPTVWLFIGAFWGVFLLIGLARWWWRR